MRSRVQTALAVLIMVLFLSAGESYAANVTHGDLPPGQIHVPYNWTYANASARTSAIGFGSGDVGKLALQRDTMALYMLIATVPTWQLVGGGDTTALNASNLTSGTVPDARFPATLPALSGANLTALASSNLTGIVPSANLGTGTSVSTKFLRGDSTWQTINATPADGSITTAKLADASVTAAKVDATTVPTLGAVDNTFSSTGSSFFRVRGDNITLFRTDGAYTSVGDIGFSAYSGYRDGGAIRTIGAHSLQLSTDYSTPDTDLNLHNVVATGDISTTANVSAQSVHFPSLTVADPIPLSNVEAQIYVRSGKIIIDYYDGGSASHNYVYLPISSSTASGTWVNNGATPP